MIVSVCAVQQSEERETRFRHTDAVGARFVHLHRFLIGYDSLANGSVDIVQRCLFILSIDLSKSSLGKPDALVIVNRFDFILDSFLFRPQKIRLRSTTWLND